ncbi:MAG: hypothetical protein ACJAXM_001154 [Arenicella sp.]|jgi:hypothetical protein
MIFALIPCLSTRSGADVNQSSATAIIFSDNGNSPAVMEIFDTLIFFGMKNGTLLWLDRTIACLTWRIILRWQGAFNTWTPAR